MAPTIRQLLCHVFIAFVIACRTQPPVIRAAAAYV
jgi:hypothetical protein